MDKKSLAQQLSSKSAVSCMRSIGVGDYDVDEEHTRVEKVGHICLYVTLVSYYLPSPFMYMLLYTLRR